MFTINIIVIGTNPAYAHKAQIVGNYKMDVGWKTEPPVANEPNSIEIVLSIASDFDKQRFDAVYFDASKPVSEDAITGIADDLEVDLTIGSEKKIFLELTENSETPGTYYGEYTPPESGFAKVHIYGKIDGSEFEATFHPEKVEENTKTNEAKTNETITIPDWIRNNAKWWADGQIDDNTFVQGLQYLIKNHILNVPATEQQTSGNNEIPSWIKNNAGWWADGSIDDNSFVQGIQYMITNGIINV